MTKASVRLRIASMLKPKLAKNDSGILFLKPLSFWNKYVLFYDKILLLLEGLSASMPRIDICLFKQSSSNFSILETVTSGI